MANEKAREMGLKIKKARINANVTQAELAHRLGVTAQSISQYERGVKIPKIETLEKIANALGIKISCFYNLEPQKEQMFPIWRDPNTDPPKVEEDVLILFETACGGYGITTAHYEDGTVLSQESAFYWEEIFEWGTYDEESDDYFIPKGWWEYRYFNPDDVYNNRVDSPVVGWMPLPPKDVKKCVEGKRNEK
jgi:transcriptional regulator with XRE-family HTH domain